MNAAFFRFDNLSIFIGIFVTFFSVLITLYSFSFMRGKRGLVSYYIYIILTLIVSLGAIYSNNLLLFALFWGFLGLVLYLLISFGDKEHTNATAKKAFIIIGGTDALMLLGLGLIWRLAGSLQMDSIKIALDNRAAVLAYLCLAAGAFAKAGAMPFHTWVPDTAEDAPTPVTALLPASLDKLLGIYLLARISLDMFVMNTGMNIFLMAAGSVTIVAAVMMALVQYNIQRTLAYLTVASSGYMLLGLGTVSPIGIAGGLFYMLNSAICNCSLFLCSGNVIFRSNVSDLERLGGYARVMPISFITFLIASFAISGVPPFNGFVSKWMVYQGIIETARNGGCLWVIWLAAAMFGSALTLASFMKLIHAVFLGQPSNVERRTYNAVQETPSAMLLPVLILATLCIVFGVFAYSIPLKLFIFPSLNRDVSFTGIWDASVATFLLLAGILLGVIIYFMGRYGRMRESDTFVGGETAEKIPQIRVSGVEFYNTVKEIWFLRWVYNKAEAGLFDIYEVGKNTVFGIGRFFQYLHNGVLPTYLVWTLLGMVVLFFILAR